MSQKRKAGDSSPHPNDSAHSRKRTCTDSKDVCPACLDPLQTVEERITLECHHGMCLPCYNRMTRLLDNELFRCPFCRQEQLHNSKTQVYYHTKVLDTTRSIMHCMEKIVECDRSEIQLESRRFDIIFNIHESSSKFIHLITEQADVDVQNHQHFNSFCEHVHSFVNNTTALKSCRAVKKITLVKKLSLENKLLYFKSKLVKSKDFQTFMRLNTSSGSKTEV